MQVFQYINYANTDDISNTLDTLKSTDKEIIIFPAGTVSKGYFNALSHNGITISYFGDNSPNKVGQSINAIEILSFEEIIKKHNQAYIVMGSRIYLNDIREQFQGAGFSSEQLIFKDFSYYNLVINSNFYDTVVKKNALFNEVYELLEDELSKKTFLGKIKFMYTFNPRHLQEIRSNEQMYFDESIVSLTDCEYIVDGGGFTGDTFKSLTTLQPHYSHYYVFEPESINFLTLQNNLNDFTNTTLIQKGLWSKPDVLYFDSHDGGSHIVSAHCDTLCSSGTFSSIEVTSIDTECINVPISFIKLDIEGSEYEALLGAKHTIAKYSPCLAICIYHKPLDLVELPLLMHNLYPQGKLYMRHYGIGGTDTVCYLVP